MFQEVLVSGPAGMYGVHENDLAIPYMVQLGYPAKLFVPIPHTAHSTREEAVVLIRELERRKIQSFHPGHQRLPHRPRRTHLPRHRTSFGRRSRNVRGGIPRRGFSRGRLVAQSGGSEDRIPRVVQDDRHGPGRLSMWEALSTVRRYLWRYRWGMARGFTCLILKDLAQAMQPLMIRGAVDSFSAAGGSHRFVTYAGYLVGLALLKGVFQFWMRVIIIGVSATSNTTCATISFATWSRLSSDYYARTRTGDIMARATNDLNAVRMMLGPGRDVLDRNRPHLPAGDRHYGCKWTGGWRFSRSSRALW